MREALSIIIIVLSVGLTALILIQGKGEDMGGFLGGSGNSIQRTRRGIDLLLHRITIFTATAFFIVVFIGFFLLGSN
jgi:preprotein translocase subunit SecG